MAHARVTIRERCPTVIWPACPAIMPQAGTHLACPFRCGSSYPGSSHAALFAPMARYQLYKPISPVSTEHGPVGRRVLPGFFCFSPNVLDL
jgi:hypothetical protein